MKVVVILRITTSHSRDNARFGFFLCRWGFLFQVHSLYHCRADVTINGVQALSQRLQFEILINVL